jgi:hypothetical protein
LAVVENDAAASVSEELVEESPAPKSSVFE